METWLLGREDPLKKEMATHSSTLAWQIPWTEESGGLQSMGSQTVRKVSATKQQQQNPCTKQCKQVCAQSLSRVRLFRDLTQDWNLCLLHWKAGSLLLSCQGSQYINNMK